MEKELKIKNTDTYIEYHKSIRQEDPDQGIIFAPYIVSQSASIGDDEYVDFMKSYDENHKYCPYCNSDEYRTTLLGYILNLNKKNEYKDLNRCTCLKCGSSHTKHDRISLREVNLKKLL